MLKQDRPYDRREFGRRRADVTAWINARGQRPLRSTVVNISEGGALIDTRQTDLLPARFNLTLECGMRLECVVRHRRGSTVGVEFAISECPQGVDAKASNEFLATSATPRFRPIAG